MQHHAGTWPSPASPDSPLQSDETDTAIHSHFTNMETEGLTDGLRNF